MCAGTVPKRQRSQLTTQQYTATITLVENEFLSEKLFASVDTPRVTNLGGAALSKLKLSIKNGFGLLQQNSTGIEDIEYERTARQQMFADIFQTLYLLVVGQQMLESAVRHDHQAKEITQRKKTHVSTECTKEPALPR